MSQYQLLKFKQRIREEDPSVFPADQGDLLLNRPTTPPSTSEMFVESVEGKKVGKQDEQPESAVTTTATTPMTSGGETPTKNSCNPSVAVSLIPTEKSGFPDYSKQWFRNKYLVLVDDYICLPGEIWAKQLKISAEKHLMPFTEIVNALKGRKVIPNTTKSLIVISSKHIMSSKELSIVQRNKLLIQCLQ